MTHSPLKTFVTTAIATIALVSLAACSSAAGGGGSASPSSTDTAAVKNGASQVKVNLTSDDSCTLDSTSAKAGPVTFTVTNTGSTAITELELQSDQRILGEKENLAPGLQPVSFTVTLTGGSYQIYCPGATKELQTFTVTGKAEASGGGAQGALKAGITGYAAFVTLEVNNMVAAVATLKSAIDSGNLPAARDAYAQARPYYERIESDVDGFVLPGHSATDNAGNLDYLIDMRESNLDPAVGWHGFHAIERDLFQAGAINDNTKSLVAELSTNVALLDTLSKSLTYKPEDLANGASDLLEEVQSTKITGEEELYSHIDLVDFAANVEGAQQAFAYLKPGLSQIDSGLTARVTAQFAAVTTLLDTYRDPSALGGYVQYTDSVRTTDAPKLTQVVEALHEDLSKIAEKVATA